MKTYTFLKKKKKKHSVKCSVPLLYLKLRDIMYNIYLFSNLQNFAEVVSKYVHRYTDINKILSETIPLLVCPYFTI